jgi:D-alanine-D-alanine ligase
MMKIVAVTAGGRSSEYEISLKSAQTILDSIDREKFVPYLVVIGKTDWYAEVDGQKYPINKDDFSFNKNGEIIRFEKVYNTIHGTPGEDGKIQGYFDLLNIPYTGCDVLTSSITFNKYYCKQIVSAHGIKTATSILLLGKETFKVEEISEKLGYPCFVKPNNGGSSFGASKVEAESELEAAVDLAFEHDHQVLIEEYIKGRELTCGVYNDKQKEPHALPITEIISKNAFFDYKAKYEGQSQEITPAALDKHTTYACQGLSEKIYKILNCNGLVRIDYLFKDDILYFMEVNTTPGCSRESIIPQQIAAAGLSRKTIISDQLS